MSCQHRKKYLALPIGGIRTVIPKHINTKSIIITVKIFSTEYFLAAKLEAFNARGKGDGRMSTDFEDIVYILNNRTAIWKELTASEKNLKQYMRDEFIKLLDQKYIGEWISAHLEYVEKEREYFIIGSIQEFVDMI
jgi:hypothetical protein